LHVPALSVAAEYWPAAQAAHAGSVDVSVRSLYPAAHNAGTHAALSVLPAADVIPAVQVRVTPPVPVPVHSSSAMGLPSEHTPLLTSPRSATARPLHDTQSTPSM